MQAITSLPLTTIVFNQCIVCSVVGMTCQSCVRHIEEQLSRQRGVMGIKVSLEMNTAAVVFLPSETNVDEIRDAITALGYECSILEGFDEANNEEDEYDEMNKRESRDSHEKSPLLLLKVRERDKRIHPIYGHLRN